MPIYVYECPVCGAQEVTKPMTAALTPEYCTACFPALTPLPMRKVFTPPRVQNLTASHDSLRTFGRNFRFEGTKTFAQKIAETDAARREDNAAATLGE